MGNDWLHGKRFANFREYVAHPGMDAQTAVADGNASTTRCNASPITLSRSASQIDRHKRNVYACLSDPVLRRCRDRAVLHHRPISAASTGDSQPSGDAPYPAQRCNSNRGSQVPTLESAGGAQRRSQGPVEYPNQRSVESVFSILQGRCLRCRNR
jgi:hypothetical protein